ncbi:MAG TPA: sugar ABC transporter permease [Candidatus Egerieimonas intestinavium]|uniref:Xylose transport system permease protein XylH n=1 Tax=Candidatus Egerieimonas intestinavium TaxID=2840777 RepID=A0A9D1JEX6_9FIRM|nr:sugar ABC transporter permease [Candidatus Egerieimonas intestinavium]
MENKKKYVNLDLKSFGMIAALIIIFLIFYGITDGSNATPVNINNLIMQNGYIIILATGMLLCVLTGNIDLGVGSVVALCAAVSGKLVMEQNMAVGLAWLVALAIGLGIGLFAGFFIAYLNIPPFVVTLATMLMGRGLTYTLLQSQTVGPLPKSYTFIGTGFLPTIKIPFGEGTLDLICVIIAIVVTVCVVFMELKSIKTNNKYGFANVVPWQMIVKDVVIIGIVWFFFIKLGQNNGVPIQLLVVGVIVAIYQFITSQTVAGRQIYALGGNAKAARLSGINTKKVFFWVYVNMGVLSAIAGLMLAARQGAANPKMGDGVEMDAIASCYIGGAAAAGGVGTVIGAVVGALVMGVLNNGMSMCGLSTDFQKVVKGAVLLGAVVLDVVTKNKKG